MERIGKANVAFAAPLTIQELKLSDEMVAAATSFMHSGDPNFEGNHRWPRYEAGSRHLASTAHG